MVLILADLQNGQALGAATGCSVGVRSRTALAPVKTALYLSRSQEHPENTRDTRTRRPKDGPSAPARELGGLAALAGSVLEGLTTTIPLAAIEVH